MEEEAAELLRVFLFGEFAAVFEPKIADRTNEDVRHSEEINDACVEAFVLLFVAFGCGFAHGTLGGSGGSETNREGQRKKISSHNFYILRDYW